MIRRLYSLKNKFMLFLRYCTVFLLFPFLSQAITPPDTTRIPSKWKNESVIVLEHIYRAEETAFDDGRFTEYNKIIFYIRDKYGLQQLSTFNIPTYIVPGAEMQIGKVYKKNRSVIELTSKHLIPMYTKIDIGNRKKSRTTRKSDDGQKLAIPSLEVGDILEIEYTSRKKDFINYLDLGVNYPTLRSESSISIIGNVGYYNATIKYKPVNFPKDRIDVTPYTVSVARNNVERTEDETLSDENKTQPYIIVWKGYKSSQESGAFDKEKDLNYLEISGEDQKKEQLKLTSYLFKDDMAEQFAANNLASLLNKKYPTISDTLAYLNDLFYMYREMIAMRSLTQNSTKEDYAYDRYFTNVVSRVLFEKEVPYKVFVSQADYYGPPNSEHEIVSARYGIYIERLNYFLFNPFLYAFPNQVPAYFEDQVYVSFNANKHFFPAGGKKKYCTYGFWSGTFPHSTADQNLTHTDVTVSVIDLQKQTCNVEITHSYWGKNKNRFTRNICSNTLLYELADNPYRDLIKKHFPYYINIDAEPEKQDGYLKHHLLEDLRADGYDPLVFKSYQVGVPNFFEAEKPIVSDCVFETDKIVVNFDNYLILNLGKLLGNQLAYVQKDSVRQNDFFIPYKKKYTFLISIQVPVGYTTENLSDLDLKFSSPAGKFESKATLKGNFIEIRTEKSYNFVDYSRKDVKDIKGFLDLATEFTQKKLVLKKS